MNYNEVLRKGAAEKVNRILDNELLTLEEKKSRLVTELVCAYKRINPDDDNDELGWY